MVLCLLPMIGETFSTILLIKVILFVSKEIVFEM